MKKLLKKLLNECPNAKIIVTGYYPIFTEHTDSVYYNELYPRVHDFLFEKPPSEGYRIALIENSRVFHDISDRSLRTAVEQVTSEQDALGRNRAVFVPVNFPTEKCLGVMTWHRIKSWNYWRPSYNSLLWNFDIDWLIKIDNELKNNKPIDYAQIKTDDQIYQYRVDNCNEKLDKINAIAHPNIMGANRYFDAIKEQIEEKGLTWLDPDYKDFITIIANDLENVFRSPITQQTGAVVDIFSRSPPEEWNKTFGGDGYDEAHSIQITPDGGFIIVGDTRSSDIGGEGDNDAWLFKTDSEGNEIWSKTFGGANDDAAYSVQITPDNGFIIVGETRSFGTGNNDVWIIKTDSEGNEIWSKTFGGANDDLAHSVQTTPDGGFIIAGETRSFSELGRDAGPLWSYPLHPRDSRLTIDSDIWLIKIDAYGNELWNRTFGQARARDDWTQTGADDGAYSVQITPDGGYILAGFTEGTYNWLIKTDDNGNEIWSKVSDEYGWAFSVQTTRDNNYISSGWDWLTKTDAQGNEIWRKTFGEANIANSVQITADGGFVIAGSKDGKAMLIKTNAQGSELWIKTFGNGWANSVQNTFDGGYVLAGLSGDCDAWLVKVKSI